GLYDNDHRRIRHSTLDEVPSLVSASVVGTLVLDGLLALSPVGPFDPISAIAIGVGALVGSFVARRVSTHPETRLLLVGYLSDQPERQAAELPLLGPIADIAEVAAELEVE